MKRHMIVLSLMLVGTVVCGCTPKKTLKPHVRMTTSLGEMVVELDGEKAPRSCLNFVQYVKDGFYDGTIFHKVEAGYVILGGGYTPQLDRKLHGIRPGIQNEWTNGLKHKRGTIAVSRLTGYANSAASQFFINVADNDKLDEPMHDGAGFAVFGKVTHGLATVDKIANTPVGPHKKYFNGRKPFVPQTPVVIESITMLEPFDEEAAQKIVDDEEEKVLAQQRKRQQGAISALEGLIATYTKEAGRDAVTTDSGLIYVDMKVGDGLSPGPEDTVSLHYHVTFVDGRVYDSSRDKEPIQVAVRSMLRGPAEGVMTMRVGGVRKLILEPALLYGDSGRPGVHGGPRINRTDTMIYEIELLAITE